MQEGLFRQFENIGFVLLAVWLIITGALRVVGSSDLGSGPLFATLGIVAGVYILIGRFDSVFDQGQD